MTLRSFRPDFKGFVRALKSEAAWCRMHGTSDKDRDELRELALHVERVGKRVGLWEEVDIEEEEQDHGEEPKLARRDREGDRARPRARTKAVVRDAGSARAGGGQSAGGADPDRGDPERAGSERGPGL